MSSPASLPARTASLRVTQQEYDALQCEAKRQGYKLSHLMRHRIFGKSSAKTCEISSLNTILHQFTALSGELMENGGHIRLIAKSLDEGFRDPFGLDRCLQLLERLGEELQHVLAQIENNVAKTSCFKCEDQTS